MARRKKLEWWLRSRCPICRGRYDDRYPSEHSCPRRTVRSMRAAEDASSFATMGSPRDLQPRRLRKSELLSLGQALAELSDE